MVAVEYAEFLQQFRECTAKRMEEFEKSLAAAEKLAQKHTEKQAQEKTQIQEQKKQVVGVDQDDRNLQPARRIPRGRGPVRSVLREA